jgi:hypothetical protein
MPDQDSVSARASPSRSAFLARERARWDHRNGSFAVVRLAVARHRVGRYCRVGLSEQWHVYDTRRGRTRRIGERIAGVDLVAPQFPRRDLLSSQDWIRPAAREPASHVIPVYFTGKGWYFSGTMTHLRTTAFVLSSCAAVLAAAPAHAQVLSGSLVIDARDQSGASLPGASVTITQTETNWTRSGTTDETGTVTFTTVPLGTYSVKVSLSGFTESVTNDVRVAQDAIMRVRSTLGIGQLTDTVTVSAAAEVLQTDRADVRTEINSRQLENLPVPLGRNYQNLFVMIPGVSPPENMHSVAVNPSRGLGFNSNGTTRNANAIRIEGAISNNLWLPHVAAYVPALEAIETVSVVTSTFDADQGLSGGMSANVVIKSGTNNFRGSVFEYHFNEALKAKPFFLPAGQDKPDVSQNQFGGTLGGPIVRNKLFFFGSWEGTYDRQLATRFGTVPTAAMRRGDFSASPTPIYDPLTGAANGSGRTPFPGNIIPANRLDPIVQRLIADLPLPTDPNLLSDNYFATGQFEFKRRKTDAKVTLNATDKLMLSGRLGWLNYDFDSPAMFGDLGGQPHRELRGDHDDPGALGAVPDGREPRPRLPRHSRNERSAPRIRRVAPLRDHRVLENRLRRQRELAVCGRQLAVPVFGQRELDERCPHLPLRRRHRPAGHEPA